MALSSMRTAVAVSSRQLVQVELRARPSNGLLHQLGQIDRTQQAGAIGRQGLLAAGIGGADGLAIGEIVLLR